MLNNFSEVRGHIWPLSGVKGQEISQAHLAAIGCNGLTACSEAKQVADEKVLFPDTYTILLDLPLLNVIAAAFWTWG